MKRHLIFLLSLAFFLINCEMEEPQNQAEVQVIGALKNVMHKGELQGVFDLNTLAEQLHTYGLGPIEYLQGELLLFDGIAYQSRISVDSSILIKEDFQVKVPFFVHTQVQEWEEHNLPESIQDISTLEAYIEETTQNRERPFAFRLEGTVEKANIHVINLPEGTAVRSHQDAHQGMVNYELKNKKVDILGFFSTSHQGIFTHHDSYVHMHLLTKDRTQMGHLDKVNFNAKNIKLVLPKL